MTYRQKLRDPRWARLKCEAMLRDNFACLRCGATDRPLNVHHLRYAASGNPWDVPVSDCATLCVDCHEAISKGVVTWTPAGWSAEPPADDDASDAIYEAFAEYGVAAPRPSVLADCRRVASEACILWLMNRLAWDGTLAGYATRPEVLLRVA